MCRSQRQRAKTYLIPYNRARLKDELKPAAKAFNWLKEDADKARAIVAVLHGTPPEKIG